MAKSKEKDITIRLKEKGADETKRKIGGVEKSIGSLATGVLAGAASFYTLRKAFDIAIDLGKLHSKITDLDSAFRGLTKAQNLNADLMLKKMRTATAGTVSEIDLLQQANNALLLDLPVTEQDMGLLAEAGRRLGKAMGIDAKQGLESLVVGIGRQSKLWLDNLGIIVDTEKAYINYANQVGKTSSQLSDAEKKIAFYNATMDSVKSKMDDLGPTQETFNDNLQRAKVSTENISLILSEKFVPLMNEAASSTDELVSAFEALSESQAVKTIQNITLFLARWQLAKVKVGLDTVTESLTKSDEPWKRWAKNLEEYNLQQEKTLNITKNKKGNTGIVTQYEIQNMYEASNLMSGLGVASRFTAEQWERIYEMLVNARERGTAKLVEDFKEIDIDMSKLASDSRTFFDNLYAGVNAVNAIYNSLERINNLFDKSITKWNFRDFLQLGLGIGGIFTGFKGLGFAKGADFTVPSGYPNDSFGPMFASSGERVTIKPSNSTTNNSSLTVNVYGNFTDVDRLADEIATRSRLGFNRIATNA